MNKTESQWFQETLKIRCPNGTVPNRLYKFLSSESKYFSVAMEDLMLRNRVRLSSRKDFNDPFDTMFGIDFPSSPEIFTSFIEGIATRRDPTEPNMDYVERAKADPEKFREDVAHSIGRSLDSIGIYSLTENVDHPLMWAHYANSHKGIALVFRHGTKETFGAFPMRYQDHFPRALIDEDGIPLQYAFVKGRDWEYEREWRMAHPNAAHTSLDLPHNYFAGIVFGAMAEQKTYDFMLGLIKQRAALKLPPVLVHRAAAGESFDLEFYRFEGADIWNRVEFPRFVVQSDATLVE